MLAKVCVLIVGLGVIACVLLGVRQQRVLAAHEMAEVQKRVSRHDRELWTLRAEIARLTTPDKVALMSMKFGTLASIGRERYEAFVKAEASAAAETALVRAQDADR